MKWLIMASVVANLLAYYWLAATYVPMNSSLARALPVVIPDSQRLILLSETPQLPSTAIVEMPSTAVAEGLALTETALEETESTAEDLALSSTWDALEIAESQLAEQAENASGEAEPAEGSGGAEEATVAGDQPEPMKIDQATAYCLASGPHEGTAERATVRQAISDMNLNYLEKKAVREKLTGYWVYLPAPNSVDDFIRLSQQLKNSGLEGYLIPGGALEGNVSLGIFSKKTNAERHRKDANRKGFAPEITEAYAETDVYWYQIYLPPDSDNHEEIISRLNREKTEKEACQKVASRLQFN